MQCGLNESALVPTAIDLFNGVKELQCLRGLCYRTSPPPPPKVDNTNMTMVVPINLTILGTPGKRITSINNPKHLYKRQARGNGVSHLWQGLITGQLLVIASLAVN